MTVDTNLEFFGFDATPFDANRVPLSLHEASECGNITHIDTFLASSPIDSLNNRGETALARAVACGQMAAAKHLILRGAKTDIPIIEPDGKVRPLKSYALICELPINSLIPPNPTADKYLSQLILAHVNSIGGTTEIDGINYALDGFNYTLMLKIFSHALDKHDPVISKIRSSLEAALTDSPAEIVAKIQRGELVFVPASNESHVLYIVFYNGYCVICNRGNEKPDTASTLECFQIDPTMMKEALLQELLSEGFEFIYDEMGYYLDTDCLLDTNLSLKKDLFCLQVEAVAPQLQKTGNCTFASLKGAFQAAYYLVSHDSGQQPDKRKMREWSVELRKRTLEIHTKRYPICEESRPLVEYCYHKYLSLLVKTTFL